MNRRARRAAAARGGAFEGREAARAAHAALGGAETMAIDEVRYLLTIPVTADHTLTDRPGFYAEQGVSLQRLPDGWVFSFNPARLAAWTREAAAWGGAPTGGVLTAPQWLTRVLAHPGFRGACQPPGAVGKGWYCVLLDPRTHRVPRA